MKTDAEIKQNVVSELEWDPSIDAARVGVAVKDQVVTLTGHLDNFAQKYAIERAVQRVAGVRALAIELDVKLDPHHVRSDADIALAAEQALTWHALVPHERVRVQVEKGWVTLNGEVDWHYQREGAAKAVRELTGVTGVTNAISLRPQATPNHISDRIRAALTRQVEREARRIEVSVEGATATLRGDVHSWAERTAAEGATWSAPGIRRVVNELQVGSSTMT